MRKFAITFLLVLIFAIITNLSLTLKNIKTTYGCTIKKAEYTDYINVSGEFESREKTDIVLSYPVYVKEVFVKENDYVNKGQAVFTIDKEKMESLLNGNMDDDTLNRLSYSDLSSVNAKQNAYSNIYILPDTIYASDSGIVSNISVFSGSVTLSGKKLMTITKDDDVVAKFTLSQTEYGKVKVGDSVAITPVAFSDTNYNGSISNQNAVVKKQTTATGKKVVVEVFATIENPDKKVSDGLQINGKIKSGETAVINVLDYSYISQDENGEFVYVLNKGEAEKIYIETGAETQSYIQVLTVFPENTVFLKGDIKDGDKVIVTGDF